MAIDAALALPALAEAPGPRGWKLFESLLHIRRDRISFVESSSQQFGDLVAFRMGPKRLFLFRTPELFRHVLVEHSDRYVKGPGLEEARPFLGKGLLTSKGEEWREDRAKFESAMHGRNFDSYAATVDELTREFLVRIGESAKRGEIVEVSAQMSLLTLRIVGRALLGWDFGDQAASEIAADLHTLNGWAMQQMMGLFAAPLWCSPSAASALRRLRSWANRILEKIRGGEAREGACAALTHMLATGDVERTRDHIITFLLAGHETSALTLSWAVALLARHPEAAGVLADESADLDLGRRTWASIQNLSFTRQVIEETLRLYPPVWLLPRKTIEQDRVGPYEIPAGSGVLLCVYLLHRHPAYWDRPLQFRPSRFSRQESGARPAGAYLPFGAGSRACLASRFGLMETMSILSALASRFRWEACWNGELRSDGALSLHPVGGVPVRFFAAHR